MGKAKAAKKSTEAEKKNKTTQQLPQQADTVELEAKFAELENKVEENWRKFLHASAELENVRKRAERDIANAHKYSVEKCIKELIPVIDSLEQGIVAGDDNNPDVKSIHEGMELTLKLFLDTLNKFGLKQLDPQGEPFDPQFHEAVSTQPDDKVEVNTVINVLQKGYALHGRVIRPAMVIVSKPPQ